ncbi:MAG TPA: LysR family transcriptional regulator [Caulobacteraceae bacterium]|nr:LysR family transcriptional regulator [Caulobacteraceae bacterium]
MVNVVRRRANWTDLRLFWAVAELGSFGAAARKLELGLTTVTRAIDKLEDRLGAKLFMRGPQGVSLTEAGRLAYDRALSMERMAEGLENDIAGIEKAAEGSVKLMAPDGIAGIFLTPFIPEFLRANPKVDLTIDCGLWPDKPMDGDVDITLTFTEPKQPDSIAMTMAHFHYAVFASREYLDLYGTPESYEDTVTHPYVHHVGQDHQRESWTSRAVPFLEFMHRRIETNSSAVSFAAVKHGAGTGAMPTAIIPLEPSLVMLDAPPLATVKLWLVYHRDVGKSARVRCVIDWLKEVFDPRTKPWYRAEFIHPREFPAYLDHEAMRPCPIADEDPVRRRSRTRRLS